MNAAALRPALRRAAGVRALAPLALTACGREEAGGGGGSGGADGGQAKVNKMTILVGTEPGGGFDLTARAFAKAAKEAGLAGNVQVQNVPGAGNAIALARLANQEGNAGMMQMMGLGLVGGIYANKSKATLEDTTPLARLAQESIIFVVPADSKYRTMDDLVRDWKADPSKVVVGSGSNPGGSDHVPVMLAARAAGIDPKEVNHVSFDGGGELNTALLGNKISFGSTGVSEVAEQVEAGRMRALAVTASARSTSVDAPTLQEAGLDTSFVNWRGLVAPPGLAEGDAQRLSAWVEAVAAPPEWKAALKQNAWTDAFMPTAEYGPFVKKETAQVEGIMTELGLAS